MFGDGKAPLDRDYLLPLLDFAVKKLLNPTAIQTHQVIMMRALIQFKNSLACFEMIAVQESGLFELREHPIDGGQPDIHVFG